MVKLFFKILKIAIFYGYISYIDYASDQEWFRYLTLNLFFWFFLIGFTIADFLYVKFYKIKKNSL